MKMEKLRRQIDGRQNSFGRNFGIAVSLILVAIVAGATVPYVLKAGDPIRASEINANLQYLETLASLQTQGDLIKYEFAYSTSVNSHTLTIPSDASRPYVLRSVQFGSCSNGVKLSRTGTIDSAVIVRMPESSFPGGTVSDLSIPFSPGETLTVFCDTGGHPAVEAWLVFAR